MRQLPAEIRFQGGETFAVQPSVLGNSFADDRRRVFAVDLALPLYLQHQVLFCMIFNTLGASVHELHKKGQIPEEEVPGFWARQLHQTLVLSGLVEGIEPAEAEMYPV